jgi:hypothetical protein
VILTVLRGFMSKLHVRHVRDALERLYTGKVDLSDYANASESHRTKAFLSRALAALAVQRSTDLPPDKAAGTIIDGTKDNGLDAICIDRSHSRIILVQSKWDGSGVGTLGLGDARNFIAGFKDLTDEKYDRFNSKIEPVREQLSDAFSDPSVTFDLIVATTGQTSLEAPAHNAFDDMLEEVNNPQPLARLEILGLNEFHTMISRGIEGTRIDLDVVLENWGTVTEPYEAYYGTVGADVIAEWYDTYGDKLFAQNIRNPLGDTIVNEALTETLTSRGENFWYFNNGVTILCDKVAKRPRGVANRTYGDFALQGASVVNGAQTVASIYNADRKSKSALEHSRVWVRFISLEGCPPDFASEVTRATNTQNTVDGRDFVALDPEQSRLRTELLLSLRKTYSIKRGDQQPSSQTGCTVTEASVALACANRDPNLAVLAKATVGRLWESTERPPYMTLFNSSVTPFRLWRCVETMRAVDAALDSLKRQRDGRARAVAVQGNRMILHLVFRAIDLARIDDPDFDWDGQLQAVPKHVQEILDNLTFWVESEYANNYITSLFKNSTKCRDLAERVRDSVLS